MSRRSIFKTAEIAEIKKEIRNGVKIKQLARNLAPKYNLNERQMLTKLYYISAHTYMLKKNKEPKAVAPKNTTATTNPDVRKVFTSVGKKVEMYADHIRIYF